MKYYIILNSHCSFRKLMKFSGILGDSTLTILLFRSWEFSWTIYRYCITIITIRCVFTSERVLWLINYIMTGSH